MANTILDAQFTLKWRDALRGFILAVGTPVLYVVQELIPNWNIDNIWKIAISAGIAYLLKNFFEPTKVIETQPSENKIENIKLMNKAK